MQILIMFCKLLNISLLYLFVGIMKSKNAKKRCEVMHNSCFLEFLCYNNYKTVR